MPGVDAFRSKSFFFVTMQHTNYPLQSPAGRSWFPEGGRIRFQIWREPAQLSDHMGESRGGAFCPCVAFCPWPKPQHPSTARHPRGAGDGEVTEQLAANPPAPHTHHNRSRGARQLLVYPVGRMTGNRQSTWLQTRPPHTPHDRTPLPVTCSSTAWGARRAVDGAPGCTPTPIQS